MENSGPTNTQVAELKAEGNAFFVQKNYEAAIKKYTLALKLDDKNAVLYCNRSACRLAQGRYLDACGDAKKAVELDEQYAKAHARLASAYDAMGTPSRSVEHWERAVALIPNENLTPAEVKQRDTYVANLEAARRVSDKGFKVQPSVVYQANEVQRSPWALANALIPSLRDAEDPHSSAWVIHGAHEDFRQGLEQLKSLKITPTPNGPMMFGHLGTLSSLTNGILRDNRVFYIDDPKFLDNYNSQVQFEATRSKAWVDGSPEEVITKARKLLSKEGWDAVRPALSVSVRGRFMRGFLQSGLMDRPDLGAQFIGHAIEIIKLGNKEWPNVPTSERGAIFQETFLFGLQAEWLDQYMRAYSADPGEDSKFPLETLRKEADALISSLEEFAPHLPQGCDPGFIYSFYSNPLGTANAMKGFYHTQIAENANRRNDHATWFEHIAKAGMFYLIAAKKFAQDDENHLWYLNCALDSMFATKQSLEITLPLMRMIRDAYPKMQLIWANSTLAKQGRDNRLTAALALEQRASEMLEQNIISMKDVFDKSQL